MENRPKSGYGYIYKYTSPSGKSYIGQTIRSLKERAGHNGKNYKGCSLFYQALKKYGLKNFMVEVLAEVKKDQLDAAEIKYIQLFNSLAPSGYNMTTGGKTARLSNKIKKVYQYSAIDGHLIREWESADAVAESFNTSRQVFENCLLGICFTQYGFCWSYLKMEYFPIHERIVSPENKKVRMYSMNGELLKTFDSISKAADETNSERSAIKRCCRGEIGSHNGFKWRCDEIIAEKKYNNTAKSIQQIDPISNEIIHVFPSISAAARSLNKETSLIRRVLNKEKLAYGYRWKIAQGSTTTYS